MGLPPVHVQVASGRVCCLIQGLAGCCMGTEACDFQYELRLRLWGSIFLTPPAGGSATLRRTRRGYVPSGRAIRGEPKPRSRATHAPRATIRVEIDVRARSSAFPGAPAYQYPGAAAFAAGATAFGAMPSRASRAQASMHAAEPQGALAAS